MQAAQLLCAKPTALHGNVVLTLGVCWVCSGVRWFEVDKTDVIQAKDRALATVGAQTQKLPPKHSTDAGAPHPALVIDGRVHSMFETRQCKSTPPPGSRALPSPRAPILRRASLVVAVYSHFFPSPLA